MGEPMKTKRAKYVESGGEVFRVKRWVKDSGWEHGEYAEFFGCKDRIAISALRPVKLNRGVLRERGPMRPAARGK